MRTFSRYLLSLLLTIGCLCLFGSGFTGGVNVSADTVYTQMSVEDAYSFYGSEIDCVYYSTTGYKHVTLHPSSNHNSYSYYPQTVYGQNVPSWITTENLNYVVYWASVSDYSNNPSYLGISIDPNVHFENCNALRFCAATYLSYQQVSSAAYDESFIKIFGQTELRYSNTPYIDNNIYPYFSIGRTGASAFRVLPVWCDYTSDTLSTVSMLQVGFNGGNLDSDEITVYLSCPLINDTAYGGSGVVTGTTTTSSGSGGGVTSEDLEETNGLLSSLINAVDGLIDGILSLFIPSEDFLENWVDHMDVLLHDHLGGLYEAVDEITDYYDEFSGVSALQSIHIDACNVPLAGTTLTLGNWDVPLHSQALPQLFYDALAYIIDFLAVAAFLNMCKRKVTIFLSPDSEVINDDY